MLCDSAEINGGEYHLEKEFLRLLHRSAQHRSLSNKESHIFELRLILIVMAITVFQSHGYKRRLVLETG